MIRMCEKMTQFLLKLKKKMCHLNLEDDEYSLCCKKFEYIQINRVYYLFLLDICHCQSEA